MSSALMYTGRVAKLATRVTWGIPHFVQGQLPQHPAQEGIDRHSGRRDRADRVRIHTKQSVSPGSRTGWKPRRKLTSASLILSIAGLNFSTILLNLRIISLSFSPNTL
ncbi:hypothetical protein [Stenotrophomonas sp. AB1(2024)]|uniref:hypothetical protein n=1 Tax=Stenotrophomonas sp. AB1(2024) TaxID=3132215 RepID=UPI0030AD52A9